MTDWIALNRSTSRMLMDDHPAMVHGRLPAIVMELPHEPEKTRLLMSQPRNEGISVGTRFYLNNTKFEIAFFNASRVRYAACDGGKPRTLPLTTFWELKEAGNIQLLSLDGSELATDA
jgi:hypothetical protein